MHLEMALEFCEWAQSWLQQQRHPGRHTIMYTGHSLGAAVAACCAYMLSGEAVVFDSPGERRLLERMGYTDFSPARCRDIVAYVAEPNVVNTLLPTVAGTVVQARLWE